MAGDDSRGFPALIPFQTLVLLPTNLCNFHCAHCYPSSGANEQERLRFGPAEFNLALMTSAVEQAAALPNVGRWVHIAGGEATLRPEFVTALLRVAHEVGMSGSITTNCSWAVSPLAAERRIAEWRDAGLRKLELSTGPYHRPFQRGPVVRNACEAAAAAGMLVYVRPMVNQDYSVVDCMDEVGEELSNLPNVHFYASDVILAGRARERVDATRLLQGRGVGYESCWKALNLTIRQDGWVYPCCAGSDITEELRLGSLHDDTLANIVDKANADPVIRSLVFLGPRYVAEVIQGCGGGADLSVGDAASMCHLCQLVFERGGARREAALALLRRALETSLALPSRG